MMQVLDALVLKAQPYRQCEFPPRSQGPNPKPQERKPKDAECPFKKRFMNRKGLLRGLDNLPSSNVVKPYKNLRKNPTKPLLARI